MNKPPYFSVIVPIYHDAAYVRRGLESVAQQTLGDWELVVVDNNSTDGSRDLAAEWINEHPNLGCRLLQESRRGPAAARNCGIQASVGQWIAFLDADDMWYPRKLEMVKRLTDTQQWDLICHDELAVSENGTHRPLEYHRCHNAKAPFFPQLYRRNFLSTSALVIRRDMFARVGLFDVSYLCAEDYELWLRLSPFVRPYFVPHILGVYTVRENSAIRDVVTTLSGNIRVRKKHFRQFAQYSKYPYTGYLSGIVRSYMSAFRECLLTGRAQELIRIGREIGVISSFRPTV